MSRKTIETPDAMTLGLDEQQRIVPVFVWADPDGKQTAQPMPFDLTGAFWNALLNRVAPNGTPAVVDLGKGNVIEVTITTITASGMDPKSGEVKEFVPPARKGPQEVFT